jgi:transcriptional antiterminator RfaH
MPVLPAEPNVFPPQLFRDGPEPDASPRSWWVLHTKPRQEKSLARQLFRSRVPFYLPLTAHRSLVRGRVLEAHLPLFPGYVFLWADHDERVEALTTGRVVRTLPVPDGEGLWRDLRQIARLIASGAAVAPEARLVPGATVEIHAGPLAGLRGKVIRAASGNRFVVEVNFIQQGASVVLDDYCLTAVPEPAGAV